MADYTFNPIGDSEPPKQSRMKEMTKFDEAIYILIVDLISKKERFGSKSVNLEEITESVNDNIRTSLNKLYLQQLIEVGSQKNITLKQKK